MKTAFLIIFIFPIGYLAVACAVFEWQNPKANRMFLFRDFHEVLTFQKLDTYQP